ncbi:hypothetical protein G7054_g9554 [Neopestalotiopsis clavispora]|nr:hypothetical protein G7054_g9554 [Neopestalotiopsis clavispora]
MSNGPFHRFRDWVDHNVVEGLTSEGKPKKYVPYAAQSEYWTLTKIGEILQVRKSTIASTEDLSDYICILSILAYIEADDIQGLDYLHEAIRRNRDDATLPWTESEQNGIFDHSSVGRQVLLKFIEVQWMFYPMSTQPFLTDQSTMPSRVFMPNGQAKFMNNRLIDRRQIFPITKRPDSTHDVRRAGRRVTVDYMEVHSSLQQQGEQSIVPVTVVFKNYPPEDVQTYNDERDGYTAVRDARYNDNILQCLGSFHYKTSDGRQYSTIMSELADMTLRDVFLGDELPYQLDHIHAVWESFLGSLYGLATIHNQKHPHGYFCSHQDLKPSNIFVFRRGNKKNPFSYQLKIGDFGSSYARSTNPAFHDQNRIYAPPHAYLVNASHSVAECTSDMWAIGCIMVELAVWITCGKFGLDELHGQRIKEIEGFTEHTNRDQSDCFHDGVDVLKCVKQVSKTVRENRRNHDIFTLEMVDLALAFLLVPRNERLTAPQLIPRVQKVLRGTVTSDSIPHNSVALRPAIYGSEPVSYMPVSRSSLGFAGERDNPVPRLTPSPTPDSAYGQKSRDDIRGFAADSSRRTDTGKIPFSFGNAPFPVTSRTAQRPTDSDVIFVNRFIPTIEDDSVAAVTLIGAFIDEIASHLNLTILRSHGREGLENTVETLLTTFFETLEPLAESQSQRQSLLFLQRQKGQISRGIVSMPQLKAGQSQYFEDLRALITQSDAFRWLINRLTAVMALVGIDDLSNINQCVFHEFEKYAGSTQVMSAVFVIRTRLDLFLQAYFGAEKYCNMGNVLVVVRNGREHQMLSCRDYMRQTWPSSGETTIEVLQKALDRTKSHQIYDAQDKLIGVTIDIDVIYQNTTISVCAPKLRMCDMAAQICWLAAAFQFPDNDEWSLSSATLTADGISQYDKFRSDYPWTLSFSIYVKKERAPETSSNDGCWLPLLKSCNMVSGFPILRRVSQQKGIEIALEIMAQLAGARRVTIFDDHIMLKGFSSLLLAVSGDDSSTTWHYIESIDLSRISFAAASSFSPGHKLDLRCLEGKRHFLGWTRSSSQEAGILAPAYPRNMRIITHESTGTSGANYSNIERSRSEPVSGPRFALSGINLSVSKYVSGGASFSLSERMNDLRLQREGPLQMKVYSLSRMYAVLYDERSRRGWLIDASLRSKPLVDLSAFMYSEGHGGPTASMEALLNVDFRRMKVFENRTEEHEGPPGNVTTKIKVTYWTIERMIEDLWNVFEQMHDHQEKLKSAPGIELRFGREKLEGWSFVDLCSNEPRLQARSVDLQPSGRGWVDFTRAIQAVTFLARDFGEIIKSIAEDNSYNTWAVVRPRKDYLAVRLQLLKQICDVHGDPTATPLKLANDIYWHSPHQPFARCSCAMENSGEICDRVQVFFPESTLCETVHPGINLSNRMDLADAAVIFGHSPRFPWVSTNRGPHLQKLVPSSESSTSNHDESSGSVVSQLKNLFSALLSSQAARKLKSIRLVRGRERNAGQDKS